MTNKIFGIGLSRTGTTTLSKALDILGYKSFHCNQRTLETVNNNLCLKKKVLDKYEALSDTPVTLLYKKLDVQFPNSKFILTVREINSWLTSCEYLFSELRKYKHRLTNELHILHKLLYKTETFDKDKFYTAYFVHVNDVLLYFQNRKEDLLIFDICNGESWDKLCNFLNKPIPTIPFPYMNIKK